MADGFETLIDDASAFFLELEQNNSKAWFDPRKAVYTKDIKKPAELLGDLIAEDLSRVTGQGHKAKLFRIYRDVRFSKDKTPLNAHLHLMWSNPNAGALAPAFFFGLSPSYFIMGAGIMGMQGPTLAQFRAHLDRNGDAVQDALDTASTQGIEISDWGPDPLKRVPKPYDGDHPHADLLKRKALAVSGDIPSDWRKTGLVKAINTRITHLLPVVNALQPA